MKRRWLFSGLVAVAIFAGGAVYVLDGAEEGPAYQYAAVESGPIASIVSAVGSVKLPVSISVAAEVPGQVIAVDANFNERVQAGAPLARLQAGELQERLTLAESDVDVAENAVVIAAGQLDQTRQRVQSAKAGVAGTRASITRAEQALKSSQDDLDLKRRMLATGDVAAVETKRARSSAAIADSDLASARAADAARSSDLAATQAEIRIGEAQLGNAKAQLEAKRVALKAAQRNLDDAVIRSPIDGMVIDRTIVVGETVRAGQPVFTVASDLKDLEVFANVDEADIGLLAIGQPAQMRFDAYPGQVFDGKVSDIRRSPNNNQGVVTYTVVIAAANPNLKLFPGMTAAVQITVADRPNALKIPRSALRFTPPGTDSASTGDHVWRVGHGGKLTPVPVKTGITDALYAEVLDGDVKPEEKLVVGIERSETARGKGSPFRF